MDNKVPFCIRCEKEIDIGGFLIMPGQSYEQGTQYCLECAVEMVVEKSPTEIRRIGFLKPENPKQ